MYTILGAGLSGIAVADHLSKKDISFEVFEAKSHGGGHIHSEVVDGFIWDEGPHVSFTKSEYVKEYFAENCDHQYLEMHSLPSNFYEGNWIPHPAQSNMYAIPEPIRSQSIDDLKVVRAGKLKEFEPESYREWIEYAFGKTFTDHFSEVYTQKYWTTGSENLTTDWIGKRIYFPDMMDMIESTKGPLQKETHYLTRFRYPENGGFYSYIKKVEARLPISYNKRISFISFKQKKVSFTDGFEKTYDKLISTLPLPELIKNSDAPDEIKLEASKLKCSKVLLLNIIVNHECPIINQWIYIYDKDMYSTRINFTELLSSNNGIKGQSGIQVEVYFSDYHPLVESLSDIMEKVIDELVVMQLIQDKTKVVSSHYKLINWANVIFDRERKKAQDKVLNWLGFQGLVREDDDLDPMTDWSAKNETTTALGDIILAGRFAQWKYYWTDDCVLRAAYIVNNCK